MGYLLMGLGTLLLVICFFALLSLFSANMSSVQAFLGFFVVIGVLVGAAVLSGKK